VMRVFRFELPAWLGLNSSMMNRESVIALVIQLTVKRGNLLPAASGMPSKGWP
jgi:hypothetical protein